MHELSIADAVVEIACRNAGGRPVTKVTVEAGHLRQVVPSALELAFALVAEGTAAQGARIEIVEVPAAGRCRACGHRGALEAFPLGCAACGGLDVDLELGEELLVTELEVETGDDMAMAR